MNLLEMMKSDLITAMKEKDKERLTVLRMVKGAIQLEVINNKKDYPELSENQCHKIKSNLFSSATTGLWLGGVRNPNRRR